MFNYLLIIPPTLPTPTSTTPLLLIITLNSRLDIIRMFRRMDDDGSKSLGYEEFSKGIRETGLELEEEGYMQMFENFDKDSSGQVSIDEFLFSVRVGRILP